MFLLFKATEELECGGFSDNTKSLLKKMHGQNTDREIVCTLIYGMGIHNHILISHARSFYQHKNPIAYLEVLHIATAEVVYNRDDHIWSNIHLNKNESLERIILKACLTIKKIKKQFEKYPYVRSHYITHVEKFFGLQKDHSGMFIIPESSYPWTNQLLKHIVNLDSLERNSDNLLRIKASVLVKALCSHLEELCRNWIAEDTLNIVEVYCMKIDMFPYHQDVICGGHIKESYLAKKDKKFNLQAYLDLLSVLYDIKELGNESIPFDILQAVVSVLAPQATCYLQISILNTQWTKNHQSVSQIMLFQQLNAALNNMAKTKMNMEDEKFNLNEWLELWRVLSITKFGFKEMQKILGRKTSELNKIHTWPSQALNIPQCYVHHQKNGTYDHFIVLWLRVCDQLKCKKMLSACTICVHSILKPIASNVLLSETLSISNLLNIATVLLVIIFTMLGICAIHNRELGNVYVPQSYFNSAEVFLSMAGAPNFFYSSHEDILRRRKRELPQLQNKLINLMCIILDIIIGGFSAFNPIKIATSDEKCLENKEAENCIIFVLTLLGNLGLNSIVSDENLHYFRHQISESIKHCMKPAIKQAYERFSTCATVTGYFSAIKILLEPTRDILQHMNIYFEAHHRVAYDTKQAQLMTITQRRLHPLTDISTKESKAVEIREFKLSSTATEFITFEKVTLSSEKKFQEQSFITTDTELDDFDIASFQHQESIPENTTEYTNDTEQYFTEEACTICGCSVKSDINPNHQEEDDSTSTNRLLYKEHCQSETHKTKKIEYEKFHEELDECVLHKQKLEELEKKCSEQYEVSRQDYELQMIANVIAEVLQGFETKQLEVRESAEWREGITFIREEEGKMRSLIMQAEREIENSRKKKLMLDREEEEEEKKKDEEENASGVGDLENENIAGTGLNCGESAKKKRRKRKRKKRKLTVTQGQI